MLFSVVKKVIRSSNSKPARMRRAVAGAVVAGHCAPPRRSLEVLLVPQILGPVARLQEWEAAGLERLKAALYLSLDAPAAAARVRLQHPPATCPSFHVDLLEDQLRWASTVEGSYRTDTPMTVGHFPYGPGSPTLPFMDRDVGVPAVWVRCQEEEPDAAPGGSIFNFQVVVLLQLLFE